VLLLAAFASPALAQSASRRVLLLYSYEREFAPHDAFAGLFRSELGRRFPEPIDIVELSLQAARASRTAPDQAALDNVRSTISGPPPDLVVTIGGPAATFAQTYRSELFPTTPVLLADVDRRFIDQATFTAYDTVVAVEHQPTEMIDSILRLLPDTKSIVVVIGASQLEQFWLREVQHEFVRFQKQIHFEWTNELTYDELIKRCSQLPQRSAILYGVLTLDAAGEPQVETRTLADLHGAANAPLFGLHSSQLGRGIVGGPVLSIETLSQNSVDVAVRLLQGVPPASIKVPIQRAETPVFDARELQRWGISESRLTAGSVVQFRESGWGSQPLLWILALSAAGVFALVAIVVRVTTRRRPRTADTVATLERLDLSGKVGAVTMWATGPDGRPANRESGYFHYDGLSIAIITDLGNGATSRVHPDDVQGAMDAYGRSLNRREPFQLLYRSRGEAGAYHQVLDIGVPRFIGDRFAGYVGSTIDLTALTPDHVALSSLSRRLMHTHEQHHASIARTLHEDICQRMMGLTLRLHGLGAAPPRSEVTGTMQEVSDQLSGLASEILAIPDPMYRKLDLLGFEAAARGMCRDMSTRHRVNIHFRSDGPTAAVPEAVALALLRVLGEAATNAVRHSGGTEVTVLVTGSNGEIQLRVTDDGVGFDVDGMPDSDKVGLVSMRERLRMVAGECEIQSKPGAGTCVMARAPLHAVQVSQESLPALSPGGS